ncbi:hypothetical protein Gotur_019613 [Gossypium turneri]
MLEKVLPHAMLKAKLNLESMIRTLKRDWAIVYDMLSGKDNSGFAGQFRHHSFPYYDQLTSIYAKVRATGKDAQTAADIVEEIDAEDVATTNNLEEGNNYHRCEGDAYLDEMDVSATQLQPSKPNQDGSTFSKKKKKRFLMEEHCLRESASRKCSKFISDFM